LAVPRWVARILIIGVISNRWQSKPENTSIGVRVWTLFRVVRMDFVSCCEKVCCLSVAG